MAHPQNQKQKSDKTSKTAAPTATEPAKTQPPAEPAKKKTRSKKVRVASKNYPAFSVVLLKSVYESYGAPYDAKGDQMLLRAGRPALTPEEQAARTAAKEAEKKTEAEQLAKMSPEERLAWDEKRRAQRLAKKAAKKTRERDALLADLKEKIRKGEISLD